ncbi:unnamed protein product [Lactuca saligna]|uniref:Uncharacterized protein n=1 Tax=Lactuca saligna TaxID=75948 RepID=A0AA35Z3R1_LACSI|nr:unnamed protein product [Lactuca saligna]
MKLNELLSERVVVKSCVSDVNSLLSNIVEGNVASGSRGKEKVIEDEEEEEDENEKLKHKACDVILDENMRIAREAEENEKAEREAQTTLAGKKLLFPPWSLEPISNEALDNLRLHWLEPITSFELKNTLDLQLDFPITKKQSYFVVLM